jgi:small subunit ribosomal protein S9
MKKLVVSGKRKTAIAKATIEEGNGKIEVNDRPLSLLPRLKQLEILEPLIIARDVLKKINFDVSINVKGGGSSSQIEASRLALARAIVEYTKNIDVKNALISYDRNLFVADTRRKEVCKPGDSKARAMRQSSKR